jgi:hypothetical protein
MSAAIFALALSAAVVHLLFQALEGRTSRWWRGRYDCRDGRWRNRGALSPRACRPQGPARPGDHGGLCLAEARAIRAAGEAGCKAGVLLLKEHKPKLTDQ